MQFESDFAKIFDNAKVIIAETNFQKLYHLAFTYYKNCSMAKIRKELDKNSKGLCLYIYIYINIKQCVTQKPTRS